MTSRIELDNIIFSYRGEPILKNLSLMIDSGEFIGIFGPNGGGKTTLLKLLMGFLQPQNGSIRIFGQSPHSQRHRIGYVPQVHRADSDFPITVEELIGLGRLSRRRSPEDIEECERWMENLGLLAHRHSAYGELSGGLAQRALLARALASDPDLLLLDEPTANVDSHSLGVIFHILKELKGKKTILFVTHDLRTIVPQVNRLLCIQGTATTYKPEEVCQHFALGLYHTKTSLQPLSKTSEGALS